MSETKLTLINEKYNGRQNIWNAISILTSNIHFPWMACNFQVVQNCIFELPSILMSFESGCQFC